MITPDGLDIPRALSTDEESPHYRKDFVAVGRWLDILLDGDVVDDVSTYDMDAGVIIRAKTDADGNIQLNEARDGVELETLHGLVTVVVRAAPHGSDS